jgi:hypothetical protein
MNSISPVIETEMKTVAAMIRITCADDHSTSGGLCGECQTLDSYAHNRLKYCQFGENKPACIKCPVHCYKSDMREKIRHVMRHAGPKMLWKHPWLALLHLWKEHRPRLKLI